MLSFFLSLPCAVGFYHLFYKLNKPQARWRAYLLLTAVIFSRPLHLLWQKYHYASLEKPSFLDITVVHIALYLLVWVLLGSNRKKGLISASFTFSIINITHIPVANLVFFIFYPLTSKLGWVETIINYPQIYNSMAFTANSIIAVCCYFASRWLQKTNKSPSLKLYISFNIMFVLFSMVVLIMWHDILGTMSISFLFYAIISLFFLIVPLYLFYLYTHLTTDNSVTITEETKNLGHSKIVQQLSKREKQVVAALLAGHLTHKELSNALNISVNTVKTHLQNIYSVAGVSNMASLVSLLKSDGK